MFACSLPVWAPVALAWVALALAIAAADGLFCCCCCCCGYGMRACDERDLAEMQWGVGEEALKLEAEAGPLTDRDRCRLGASVQLQLMFAPFMYVMMLTDVPGFAVCATPGERRMNGL